MSKTTLTDGQMQVDCDINGVPICIGRPLSLPHYDVLTIDECRVIVAPLIEMLKRRTEASRPCRCGQDGCADSTCPARKP